MKNKDLKCKICGRTISLDNKLKFCPDCINKYGTPVAGGILAGILYGARVIWKNFMKK